MPLLPNSSIAISSEVETSNTPIARQPIRTTYYPRCLVILKSVFDGFGGDDSSPQEFRGRPRSCNVHINGYRRADTFDIEFDLHKVPFRPELFKNSTVEIYLQQSNRLILDDLYGFTDSDLVLTGIVDDVELNAGDEGLWIHFSGRDYTAFFLDKAWPKGQKVKPNVDLKTTIQALVTEVLQPKDKKGKPQPGTQGHATMQVVFAEDAKTPDRIQAGTTVKHDKIVDKTPTQGTHHGPRTARRGGPVRSGRSYWDVIYSVCLQVGLIPHVRRKEIVITTPQIESRLADPFFMEFGQNIKTFEVKRHMGREQVPQIIATSHDPVSKKAIQAKYPEKLDPEVSPKTRRGRGHMASVLTSVDHVKEQFRYLVVDNVQSLAQLKDIAEMAFFALGRSEGKLKFTTSALSDLNGNDLLKLQAGSAIVCRFDPFLLQDLKNLATPYARTRLLLERGFDAGTASLIANGFNDIKAFETPYYVTDVAFSYSNDQGIQIETQAQGYVYPAREEGTDAKA